MLQLILSEREWDMKNTCVNMQSIVNKPEELSEILDRLTESTKGMNSLEEWEST